MRLDGLPSYDKKYHGKTYLHVGTFDSSDSLFMNKKEATQVAAQYKQHGCKCLIDRHGKGFAVYACES